MPSRIQKHHYALCPEEYYETLKKNVDSLKLIQLGLTLSDSLGNMHTWQFNFCDFDPAMDLHSRESIAMLRNQGMDFTANKFWGVDLWKFALGFRPILNLMRHKNITWATYRGSYDFAFSDQEYYMPVLAKRVDSFMELMSEHFGLGTFDLKLIARSIGIHGGLEKVATQLGLQRAATGLRHQAGSDSLLVMQVFMKIYKDYKQVANSNEYSHKLYGLTLSHSGIMYQPSSSSSSSLVNSV